MLNRPTVLLAGSVYANSMLAGSLLGEECGGFGFEGQELVWKISMS